MAWTQAELDQVRAAIMALIRGERVASVSYAGPPARSVSYQAADLGELREILAEMERTVAARPGYRLVATRKGV